MTTERPVPEGLDLTVEAAAEAVTAAGGKGYAISCDLRDTTQEATDEIIQRVEEAEGRLDLLVCSAFTTPPGQLRGNFWEQGLGMWDACNGVGLRTVYGTCCSAAPLMIKSATASSSSAAAPPPLVVLVSSFGGQSYTFNVAYGVGKAAVDRLASDMSVQLRKHNVGVVSLYPGVVKTEANLQMDVDGEWAEASGGLDLQSGETPELSGKAVAALASLERETLLSQYSGNVVVVAELAEQLGFREADGSLPPSIRSLRYLAPNFIFPQIEEESGKPLPDWVKDNVPDIKLPWSVFSSAPPPERT